MGEDIFYINYLLTNMCNSCMLMVCNSLESTCAFILKSHMLDLSQPLYLKSNK